MNKGTSHKKTTVGSHGIVKHVLRTWQVCGQSRNQAPWLC